jgi:hypothetical protein
MNRLVVILGTTHEVQNGEKYWRRVNDPHFKPLLDFLVAEDGIDFILKKRLDSVRRPLRNWH